MKIFKSLIGKKIFSQSAIKNSQPRHLINTIQLTNEELAFLVKKAENFKKCFKSGEKSSNNQKLLGKLIALLFSKRSTRTRISTEGAAAFFGAQPIFLGKDDIQLGVNESLYDTTKVISSMTSCIFARVSKHQEILNLCNSSSIPIINALCDMYHPLQAITDILTIKEAFGKTKGLKLTWIGDANNVINDLSIAALKSGISTSVCIPKGIEFNKELELKALELAKKFNLSFDIYNNPIKALEDANIIATDTWISMGEGNDKFKKLKQFEGYQITNEIISKSNVNKNWKFMHCLPRHPEEVSDDIFYSDNSLVFQEAENRLYVAMAVIDGFVINKGDLLK